MKNKPKVVFEIGQIHFEGNITPHEWFQHVKMSSGKPDLVGITLLSEIVYWYRPTKAIDERTGKPLAPHKKFRGDMLQTSASYYEKKFGLSKNQTRDALKRLENAGYIRRELRTIKTGEGITQRDVY
jgi:hypothetical protein